MKKLITMVMLFILIMAYSNYANSENNTRAIPFDSFVIAGWVGPHHSEKQYALFQEGGFNYILDYYDWEEDEDYKTTLKLSTLFSKLNVIINLDQRILHGKKNEQSILTAKIKTFLASIKEHKKISGYFLYDEPEMADVEMLSDMGKLVHVIDPQRSIMMNYYCAGDFPIARSFLKSFTPSAIAMDYYPYEVEKNRISGHYQCLEGIRQVSLDYNVPFFAFVQSAEWFHKQGDKRLPIEAEIRLQVYANLAYGAKGLFYYTYVVPRRSKSITMAILDNKDQITNTYLSVKKINSEVLTIAPTLINLRSVEVVHTGAIVNRLRKFTPDQMIAGIDGDNLIIGRLISNDGINFMLIVNKDTEHAKSIKFKVAPNIKSVSLVNKQSGKVTALEVSRGVYRLSLKPGDGQLLKFIKVFN